jgi:hypothetical protein
MRATKNLLFQGDPIHALLAASTISDKFAEFLKSLLI